MFNKYFANDVNFLIALCDFCGVIVSTAGRIVKETSYALAGLSNEYIKFPDTKGMQQTKKSRKLSVLLIAPTFVFNRQEETLEKYSATENVISQSTSKLNIFKNSRLKFRMEDGQFQNYVILGDSGYKQCKYMMTPLQNPPLSSGLRLTNKTKLAVIVACAVLHNIAIIAKDPLPTIQELLEPPEELFSDNPLEENGLSNCNSRAGTNLIENYFAEIVYSIISPSKLIFLLPPTTSSFDLACFKLVGVQVDQSVFFSANNRYLINCWWYQKIN
ncbi:hypothetical protein CVS40_11348 [Lucilia cuprina]|nr:hypothetical protein CVS40_11348 [Lucilia cuprina]